MCLKGPLDSVPPADSSSRAACADPEGAAVADCVGVPTSGWLIPPRRLSVKPGSRRGRLDLPGLKSKALRQTGHPALLLTDSVSHGTAELYGEQ